MAVRSDYDQEAIDMSLGDRPKQEQLQLPQITQGSHDQKVLFT